MIVRGTVLAHSSAPGPPGLVALQRPAPLLQHVGSLGRVLPARDRALDQLLRDVLLVRAPRMTREPEEGVGRPLEADQHPADVRGLPDAIVAEQCLVVDAALLERSIAQVAIDAREI